MYFSSALTPPEQSQDPQQAHQIAYFHVKDGIVAACFVFLGAPYIHTLPS